jgi:putative chitinase
MTPNERAHAATNYLFNNDAGEKGVRLALIGPDGRELGGWSFDLVVDVIERQIEEALVGRQPFAITANQLRQIMPTLTASKLSAYWPFLNEAMEKYQINTPLRAAAFLAQLAHESGELKYFEEIWGPTSAQKRYEGRADLGNTQPGDGYRFRGRGPIQLTGRANYKKYGELLGVDLVNNPDLASSPEYAFQTAALYWKSTGCNGLADDGTDDAFRLITRMINGGLSGLADRQQYYERAKKALGIGA